MEVCGSSYEMGYQHGAQVAGLVRRYIELIEKLTGQPQDVLSRNALAFLPTLRAFSPAFRGRSARPGGRRRDQL